MLSHWGWHSVPIAIFPFAALALALIVWQIMRKRSEPNAPQVN
jgi:predicted MFS family arabinose efflux permease